MKITYCYSNLSSLMRKYHEDNVIILRGLFGFDVESICLSDHHTHLYYKDLDKVHKKKTVQYIKYCEFLEKKFSKTDVLIHMNGTMIHPKFLEKFDFIKIFQCSDDFKSYGSGLDLISRHSAKYYDFCAVSNIDCLDVYEKWGCKGVFWFPLGSSFHQKQYVFNKFNKREKKSIFIGERNGVPFPIIGKYLGLYRRKIFFNKVEKKLKIPFEGYGKDWANGFIEDSEMVEIMTKNMFGINKHGFPGSVNHRMYDMCMLGMLQFCDNKSSLARVYKLDEEVIGYDSFSELNEKITHYANNTKTAEEIAYNGFEKFKESYSREKILENLLLKVNLI